MNKVYLVGNLTRDPELFETASGLKICKFGIAVNRNYVNEDGERETDFFNVIAWRGLGENCAKYLKKGNKVAIIGELRNRSYETEAGEKRFVTEIMANEVEFLILNKNEEKEKTEVKSVNTEKGTQQEPTVPTPKAAADKTETVETKTKGEKRAPGKEEVGVEAGSTTAAPTATCDAPAEKTTKRAKKKAAA